MKVNLRFFAFFLEGLVKRSQPLLPIKNNLGVPIGGAGLYFHSLDTLPTQLLRNVKERHTVDLAYLYYLPFCSVFTSKDNFHMQIGPLFLDPEQSFVNGIDLKEDLKRLNALYSALPE